PSHYSKLPPPTAIYPLSLHDALPIYALLKSALGEKGAAELAATEAEVRAADGDLGKLAGSRRTAYIGAVHTGSGNFVGTGGSGGDRKSTRLNSSHSQISYAVFCLKKK